MGFSIIQYNFLQTIQKTASSGDLHSNNNFFKTSDLPQPNKPDKPFNFNWPPVSWIKSTFCTLKKEDLLFTSFNETECDLMSKGHLPKFTSDIPDPFSCVKASLNDCKIEIDPRIMPGLKACEENFLLAVKAGGRGCLSSSARNYDSGIHIDCTSMQREDGFIYRELTASLKPSAYEKLTTLFKPDIDNLSLSLFALAAITGTIGIATLLYQRYSKTLAQTSVSALTSAPEAIAVQSFPAELSVEKSKSPQRCPTLES